jgi:hypothetical protein
MRAFARGVSRSLRSFSKKSELGLPGGVVGRRLATPDRSGYRLPGKSPCEVAL